MSWRDLDPEIRETATAALTDKQLDAWKLELAGYGIRRVADHLGIGRSAARERLDGAYRRLTAAGIRQDASGHYHQEPA